jgi:hypothetical protein
MLNGKKFFSGITARNLKTKHKGQKLASFCPSELDEARYDDSIQHLFGGCHMLKPKLQGYTPESGTAEELGVTVYALRAWRQRGVGAPYVKGSGFLPRMLSAPSGSMAASSIHPESASPHKRSIY